jgi:hypothetical protein
VAATETISIAPTLEEAAFRVGPELRGTLGYPVGPGDVYLGLTFAYLGGTSQIVGAHSALGFIPALGYRFVF